MARTRRASSSLDQRATCPSLICGRLRRPCSVNTPTAPSSPKRRPGRWPDPAMIPTLCSYRLPNEERADPSTIRVSTA